MTSAYTEDQLVEQPAISLFAELEWSTVIATEETFGPSGLLGRETKGQVVLERYLSEALAKLNPTTDAAGLQQAADALTRDRSGMTLEAANREIYELIKEGVVVSVPDPKGGQQSVRVRVIDWDQPEANTFTLVSQFSVVGQMYNCRPDLVGFVNGLPLLVVELKKPGVPSKTAFDENLTHYKNAIPKLFWYNAWLVASNGSDSKLGSITADWGRWVEWKRIEREDEPRRVSLEVLISGTCNKQRFLDLVENFTLFSDFKGSVVKVLGQNHQYLGVNNAIASMLEAREMGHGRGGVFWQTQGSGKSFSMVFFAQKVFRKLRGNWTFVIVTDRVELDDQIAKTFKSVGAVSDAEGDECHASSGEHLRELLRGNHRYVFTLIHKFQTAEVLSERSDVIVLTDEAHRSQYDTLAVNMRAALPKATFLAFTGTPLIDGEERTRDVFGDYVSIYDFQQSIEDGATVPLYYENRTPELELVNPDLNDDIYALIEDADLDDDQQDRLETYLGGQYHLITRDDRLDVVAKDVVHHFLGRGFLGKAMVVSIDKATALRMHDKVRKYWEEAKVEVKQELGRLSYQAGGEQTADQALRDLKLSELKDRLKAIETTDMAVVVSPGQNEIDQMQALGLDITPHRKRMNESQPGLDEKFKDPADPLRLVFVCAMWLTGFDAPSCSTVYLDKPMRNHTLMQTIARANRVHPGKHSGTIVDYANVFASLEKALAIYGAGRGGSTPVSNKEELIQALEEANAQAVAFGSQHEVDLVALQNTTTAGFERLEQMLAAVNAFISPDAVRSAFFGHQKRLQTLYKAIKPDPAALAHSPLVACLNSLAETINAHLNPQPKPITEVIADIAELLDDSIKGHRIAETDVAPLDLSKINFEALASRFQQSKNKQTSVEALKAAIQGRLQTMIRTNRTRADFLQRFEELIADYNAGSRNIEQLFNDLLALSKSLDDEQGRHVREGLTDEQLVLFDILTRPAPDLTPEEEKAVKKVARSLLEAIRARLVLNWRDKQQARAGMLDSIKTTLDEGLPSGYTKELFDSKCDALFQHFYENYAERDVNVYASA
jgi:type I restriction enzyme R subunit